MVNKTFGKHFTFFNIFDGTAAHKETLSNIFHCLELELYSFACCIVCFSCLFFFFTFLFVCLFVCLFIYLVIMFLLLLWHLFFFHVFALICVAMGWQFDSSAIIFFFQKLISFIFCIAIYSFTCLYMYNYV